MNIDQLAPNEPLSPELVLVFSPELRTQALANLGAPIWAKPRRRVLHAPAAYVDAPLTRSADEPVAPTLGLMLVARVGQLALVFVVVTILVLVMSLVADAMR